MQTENKDRAGLKGVLHEAGLRTAIAAVSFSLILAVALAASRVAAGASGKFFTRTGFFLLLCGVVLSVAGFAVAFGSRRKAPVSEEAERLEDEPERRRSSGRYWAADLGALLGSAALFLALMLGSIRTGEHAVSPGSQGASTAAVSWPSPEEISKNWPRFRGPGGQGVAAGADAPTDWNGETGEGILWKVEVPLKGASSPIIWGGRLFLTGADEDAREVYCFDAGAGKLLWRRRISGLPSPAPNAYNVWGDKVHAAVTPVTNGRCVYAGFANGDLACLDLEGNEVWKKSLWPLRNSYGHAASLEMYRDRLLVLLDQQETDAGKPRSKIVALDAATGRTVWETPRPVRDAWTTPILINVAGRDLIITSSAPWAIAYDAASGAEVWRVECLRGDVVPSPIYAGGLVFAVMEGSWLTAIRPDGEGDVTKTHVAWQAEGDLPSVCSPVSDGKNLFLLTSAGIMSAWDVAGGRMLWESDLGFAAVSSPTLVGDKIYVIGEEGEGVVVKAAAEYQEVARAKLGEPCQASAAFLDGRIYVRGEKHLFCVGQ